MHLLGIACIGYGYIFNRRKISHLTNAADGTLVASRQELMDSMMEASFLKFQIKSLGIIKLPKVYMKIKGRVVSLSRRASNISQQNQIIPSTSKASSASTSDGDKSKDDVVIRKARTSFSVSPWAVELADGTRIQILDSELADLDLRQTAAGKEEWRLCTGEQVLVLGLAQMEMDGTLLITRPSFSWQWFFITPKDERALLQMFRLYWRLWASTGLVFETLALIIFMAFRKTIKQ